jgi:hypothetical protein
VGAAAGAAAELQREAGLEAQGAAVEHLEALGERLQRTGDTGQSRVEALLRARGRVEHEVRAVDMDPNVTNVQRNALEDALKPTSNP